MKKKEVLIQEKFLHLGLTSRLDSRSRITLGQALIKLGILDEKMVDVFEILIGASGDILLRPRTSIPTRELWVHQNQNAMKTLKQGLKDAADGRVTKVKNLKKFVDKL